jgi:hypothetical protein
MSCFRIALVLSVLLAACSTNEVYNQDSGVPDASLTEAALLRIESEPTIGLLFGETSRIVVSYGELDGSPIAGEELRFALLGRAHDSSLSDLSVTTDERGRAEVRVTAGTTAASFRVQVNADRASPVLIDVSVSNAGFGSLRVSLSFAGEREVSRYSVALRSGMPCADAIDNPDPPDRTQTFATERAEALFATLPAEVVYAVVARGLGDGVVPIALGCVDGVKVRADGEERVGVELTDLPLDYVGDYGVEFDLATDIASNRLEAAIVGAANGAVSAAGGEGAFLFDAIEGVLESRGSSEELAAIRGLRRGSDLDGELDAAYSGSARSLLGALALFAADAGRHAERVSIAGSLTLDPMGAFWSATRVAAHPSEAGGARLPIDLESLGADPTVLLVATVDSSSDAFTIETFSLSVPLGVLGRGILFGLADARGSDLPALIGDGFGCEAFRSFVGERPALSASCDDACVVDACDAALDQLASVVTEALPSLDLERDRLNLAGTAVLEDVDADGRVSQLSDGRITGQWRARDGGDGDSVGGEFVGARMLE